MVIIFANEIFYVNDFCMFYLKDYCVNFLVWMWASEPRFIFFVCAFCNKNIFICKKGGF